MITHPWAGFRGKRVLLLQGPVGPFFRRLSTLLAEVGATTHKVNFNGGDCLFYPADAILWRGSMAAWPEFFESLLLRLNIDVVLLFGDCRPVHTVTRNIALRCGVMVGAFEEGYVRPNFITFEQYGVNGFSSVPRTPAFYHGLAATAAVPEREMGNTFWYAAMWAALYYSAASLLHPLFRSYRHHRPLRVAEVLPWLRGGVRKMAYAFKDRGVLGLLCGRLHKQFFLVPLQIAGDSQVLQHSGFASVSDFVRRVVESFAAHAPKHLTLVVKHHPLDRGYHDYRLLIVELARQHGLSDRLMYIHDQHLPTLFDHMIGAVVINSTVGLSALSHGAPVRTCGQAIYDMNGLTYQGSLAEFWSAAQAFRPDPELFRRFRAYIIDQTQINGSFYRGPIAAGPCASLVASLRGRESKLLDAALPIEGRVNA